MTMAGSRREVASAIDAFENVAQTIISDQQENFDTIYYLKNAIALQIIYQLESLFVDRKN